MREKCTIVCCDHFSVRWTSAFFSMHLRSPGIWFKIEAKTAEEAFVTEDILEFYFLKECWVSVENEFEKLVYKLAGEETSLEVRSKGPFKVIVGNAKNANLIFNGIVIDLLESSNRENNVSCVVLPSGKCSEFPRSK